MVGRTTNQRICFSIIDQQLNELLTGNYVQEEAAVESRHNYSPILNHMGIPHIRKIYLSEWVLFIRPSFRVQVRTSPIQ